MSSKKITNYAFKPKCEYKDGVVYLYVRIVPDEIRRERRKEYNKNHKKTHSPLYNIHHKIPLMLGGDNLDDNLIVMWRREHEMLHRYIIDPQIAGMKKGEIRKIMLPVMEGSFFSFSSPEFRHFIKKFVETREMESDLSIYMKVMESQHDL